MTGTLRQFGLLRRVFPLSERQTRLLKLISWNAVDRLADLLRVSSGQTMIHTFLQFGG